MPKTAFSATILTLAVSATAAVGAQSTLSSLFDRYTVKADFAGLAAAGWGASTTSVAADGKGQVIVMVRAVPYFRIFTTDGKPVKTWGDAGLFNLAHSVHVAPDGAIWASDPNAHVVHKFGADGKLLLTLGKKGTAGDDTSRDAFNQPNGLGFAPNGDIYVSDGYGNSRVVHFTADGNSSASSAVRKAPHLDSCRCRTASPSTCRAASSSPTATTSGCRSSTRMAGSSR